MARRTKILTLLAAFAVSLICCLCALGFSTKTASAQSSIEAPTADANVVIEESGFVVNDNASIRLSGKAIRFSAVVNKEFHESLVGDVTYYATLNVKGNSNVIAARYGDQPTFEEGDTFELNAYLNFDGAGDDIIDQAIKSEFQIATYAKVVNGSDVTYYMASNSKGVARSMRAVALDAYLDYEEGLGYEKSDLLDMGYFTIGAISEEISGQADGKQVSFSMPNFSEPEDKAEFIAYANAKAFKVTYDAASQKFVGDHEIFLPVGTIVDVCLFDQNNVAYTAAVEVVEYQGGSNNEVDFDIGGFLPDHEHQAGEWECVRLSTCASKGTYVKKCTVCGAVVQTLITDSASHQAGEWQIEKQATCQEEGLRTVSCLVCGKEIDSEIIEKESHDVGEWIVREQATCTEMGLSVKECSVCGETINSKPIATIAHTEGDWVQTAAPTCGTNGTEEKLCTVCGDTVQTRSVTATGAHVESDWLPDTALNVAYTECMVCGNRVQTKPLSQLQGVAISQDNVTDLLTATSGYYYLTEDIDLWSYTNAGATTKWNPTATFTGTLEGNGYTIKNFGGQTAADYKGLFYLTGAGATLRNFQIEILYAPSRAGIIGKVQGQTTIENVVVRVDMINSNYGVPFAGDISAKLTIKDTVVAVGAKYTTSTYYQGYLFSSNAANAVLDNVVVLNRSTFTAMAGSYVSVPKGTSGNNAVSGTDYHAYTSGANLVNDLENARISLPESVIKGAEKAKVLVPINSENAAKLQDVTGCGYWYLTEDVDMRLAGVTAYSGGQVSQKSQSINGHTSYHGAINFELDGRGHKLDNIAFKAGASHNALVSTTSGGTIKNINIHMDSSGGGGSYATPLMGVSRAYPGISVGGKYLYENVFITIDAFVARNASIFIGHNNIGTTFTITNVFVNLLSASGSTTALFGGYNVLSSSTFVFKDTFVVCPTAIALSISTPNYKDANGNAITPGGSGANDGACKIMTSTSAMETAGVFTYISNNLPTLFALDGAFFSGQSHEHVEGDWVVIKEPTCAAEGKMALKCSECNANIEVVTMEKLPHHVGDWVLDLDNLKAYKKCSGCMQNVVEATILRASNITELLTATDGTYYLYEDIDMTTACANKAWKTSNTFTGVIYGNGHTLDNFTPCGDNYVGLFHKVGGGAVIQDLTVKMTTVGSRNALIGWVTGKVTVERTIVVVESYSGLGMGSPFAHVIQGTITVKDSFAYINNSGSINTSLSGYFFGGEAPSASGIVDNAYVFCLQSSLTSPVGTANAATYPAKNKNNVKAVAAQDYFVYRTNQIFSLAISGNKFNLPNSVIDRLVGLGIISSHEHVEASDWFVKTQSTCAETGIMVKKCTLCGIVMETAAAPLAEHVHGEWEVVNNATCISAGQRVVKCTVCDKVVDAAEIEINSNNHVNFEWIVDEQAAASGVSRIYKFCKDCQKVVDEHVIAAPDYHNTETETFSIWAYGATPGKYIRYFVDLNGNGVNESSVSYGHVGLTYEEYMNIRSNSTHKDSNGMPKDIIVMYLNSYASAKEKAWYDSVANGGNGDGKITFDDLCDRNGDGVWNWNDNSYGENRYFYLFDNGDGSVQYIRDDLFEYYYYDANGKLVKSATKVDNHITTADAVNMTTTTENGTLDVYKAANFNTLFYTFGIDISYTEFDDSFAETVFDWAYENGLEVFAAGGTFHQMAAQKKPLIDKENGITYTTGASVDSGTKFKSQEDVNAFVIDYISEIIKHPAFKGVTFIDEPTWESFVAMGQLAQGIKAAEKHYGREIYVMENLLPYAHSAGHWKLYNGIGLKGYDAYEYYLNTYYENVGKYLGYVQYDDYPLSGSIIPYYIRTHQFTSEWAREKGIDRAMAVQSYGDAGPGGRQACSPEDIMWQMNISAAFGCKDFAYYTYFPIINTADGVDNDGEEYVVNRYGVPTATYEGVQRVNGELLVKGKALMNFQYEDMHYYTNGTYQDYFFAGCGSASCQECALVQGTLRYVKGATVTFDGAVLITELVDEESGYYGYYIVNMTEPRDLKGGYVTVSISELFDSVQIYHGMQVTNKTLTDGKFSLNLGAGDGAFIIPYNK